MQVEYRTRQNAPKQTITCGAAGYYMDREVLVTANSKEDIIRGIITSVINDVIEARALPETDTENSS